MQPPGTTDDGRESLPQQSAEEREQGSRDLEARVHEIREAYQDAHARTVKAPATDATPRGRKRR